MKAAAENPAAAVRRGTNEAIVEKLTLAGFVDREALVEQLTLNNLDVARSIARKYTGRSGHGPDLEQVACLALVRAARSFDPSRGHCFLAYAVPWITGAVKHYYRDSAWVVKPPRPVQQRHVEERGLTEHVADGVDVETCFRPWSLDVPTPGDTTPLGATLPNQDNPWEECDARLLVWQHVRRLPPRARLILYQRFVEDRTQEDIARALGVTQYHVSRLLKRYLNDLREAMADAA
jgi:RNA polymerase sigma-B factor